MDSKGQLVPAAFIPICAYQGELLGIESPEFNFTACDLFEPTLVMDQLCYTLNSTKTKNWRSEPNTENGLVLVIDPQESEDFGKLFIHTLSRFHADQAGSYKLTSLKWMTGTSQFLRLDDETKECQDQTFEKCRQKLFTKKITEHCGCVSWSMKGFDKVINHRQIFSFSNTNRIIASIKLSFFYQDTRICTPSQTDHECLERFSKENFGRLNACTGLHAGVTRVDDKTLSLYEEEKKSTTNDFRKMSDILSTGKQAIYQLN